MILDVILLGLVSWMIRVACHSIRHLSDGLDKGTEEYLNELRNHEKTKGDRLESHLRPRRAPRRRPGTVG
jgi:hypothetical protein